MNTRNALEVWLDCDWQPMVRIGTLLSDKGQIRFRYHADWLKNPHAFAIDPSLSLDAHPFFPNSELGNFGIFLDSAPDRWGQTLMKRREALQAKDEKRTPRTLYAWDFLVGVQDVTRQGALRFCQQGDTTFLANAPRAAPPVTSLPELQKIATALTHRRLDDLDTLRQWLTVLVAPGASLGGARPKANFTALDGTLWIGKFPARNDEVDVGGWEFVVHTLARRAGIAVTEAKRMRFNNEFHTFCTRRFDRIGTKRRFYASAMTLLNKEQSEGCSYLELAQFLYQHGNPVQRKHDLAQLFRRVVFNVAVGNRDDHLRNHGFLLEPNGWQLAPAFDMNANIDKDTHVLNIDDVDNRPNLSTVLETAAFYGLQTTAAQHIVDEVMAVVCDWQTVARDEGLSTSDIALFENAFIHPPP